MSADSLKRYNDPEALQEAYDRLDGVDYHLSVAADITDDQDVVVPARNARQLLRAFQGGGVA